MARLYAEVAQILLIGTGWNTATALHLAERRAEPDALPLPAWSPVMLGGERILASWCEYPHDADSFPAIGETLERTGLVRFGLVGGGREPARADAAGSRCRRRRDQASAAILTA